MIEIKCYSIFDVASSQNVFFNRYSDAVAAKAQWQAAVDKVMIDVYESKQEFLDAKKQKAYERALSKLTHEEKVVLGLA